MTDQHDRLQRQLADRSPAYQAARRVPTPAQVRTALPPCTALVDLIEYAHSIPPSKPGEKWATESRLVAFVVRPNADVVRVELGPAARVAEAVRRWRARSRLKRRLRRCSTATAFWWK